VRLADLYRITASSGRIKNSKSSIPFRPGGDEVGAVACKYLSVNSTICIFGSTDKTADCRDFHARLGSSVSVRYVQGGENREGFFTEDVETPFSVAETLESLPSALLDIRSPEQVTMVRLGSTTVVHPLRPADVGNSAAQASLGCEVATPIDTIAVTDANNALRRDNGSDIILISSSPKACPEIILRDFIPVVESKLHEWPSPKTMNMEAIIHS
jgi:hypothetical protein